ADILAASTSGKLVRYHYVGREVIDKCWTDTWEAIEKWNNLSDFADLLVWARTALASRQGTGRHVEERQLRRSRVSIRQAILRHIVERLLAEAGSASDADRESWIKQCSDLFRNDETGLVVWPSLDFLLERLEEWADA